MIRLFKRRSPQHRRPAQPVVTLPVAELLIARWHGLTPDQWTALPAIVKVDHRESYYKAWGLAG